MREVGTNIELTSKYRQEVLSKIFEKASNVQNTQESQGSEIDDLKAILQTKNESDISGEYGCIKDLSDDEVLARMEAEKEPSLLDKIKQSLLI